MPVIPHSVPWNAGHYLSGAAARAGNFFLLRPPPPLKFLIPSVNLQRVCVLVILRLLLHHSSPNEKTTTRRVSREGRPIGRAIKRARARSVNLFFFQGRRAGRLPVDYS